MRALPSEVDDVDCSVVTFEASFETVTDTGLDVFLIWLLTLVKSTVLLPPEPRGHQVEFAVAGCALVTSAKGRRLLLVDFYWPCREAQGDTAQIVEYLETTKLQPLHGDTTDGKLISEILHPAGEDSTRLSRSQEYDLHWAVAPSMASVQSGPPETLRFSEMEATVCVLTSPFRAEVLSAMFKRAIEGCFDIAGLRLAFLSADRHDGLEPMVPSPGYNGAAIVLALRRPDAVRRWIEVVGPDPMLARKTDPGSLRALYSTNDKDLVMACTRVPNQAKAQLATWFGRRLSTETPVVLSATKKLGMLTAVAVESCYIVIAPDVMEVAADVLQRCEANGFQLEGFSRVPLTTERQKWIGLPLAVGASISRMVVIKLSRENACFWANRIAATAIAASKSLQCTSELGIVAL